MTGPSSSPGTRIAILFIVHEALRRRGATFEPFRRGCVSNAPEPVSIAMREISTSTPPPDRIRFIWRRQCLGAYDIVVSCLVARQRHIPRPTKPKLFRVYILCIVECSRDTNSGFRALPRPSDCRVACGVVGGGWDVFVRAVAGGLHGMQIATRCPLRGGLVFDTWEGAPRPNRGGRGASGRT
jgi:hypothetical protein